MFYLLFHHIPIDTGYYHYTGNRPICKYNYWCHFSFVPGLPCGTWVINAVSLATISSEWSFDPALIFLQDLSDIPLGKGFLQDIVYTGTECRLVSLASSCVVTIMIGNSSLLYHFLTACVKAIPVISGIFRSVRIRSGFSFPRRSRAPAGTRKDGIRIPDYVALSDKW